MSSQPSFWQSNIKDQAQPIAPIPPAADGTPMEDWLGGVHPDGILTVTSGFYPHADRLNRLLVYLAEHREPGRSVYQQVADATGMSKTQAEAFAQYATSMQLVVPRALRVTPLGHLILQHDPFFDQMGTLWLLHYLLASNPHLVVWNMMCNTVLPGQVEISKADAANQFLYFIGRWTESSICKNVRKELRAFFSAYAEDLFARLDILHEDRNNVYVIHREAAPAPPLIFLAATLVYRDRYYPGTSGVEIPTLIYGDQSPGRLMRQGELTIRRALDVLHEADRITVESKANLDQVRFRGGTSWLDAVRAHYAAQEAREG